MNPIYPTEYRNYLDALIVLSFLNSLPSTNPDVIKVLLTAPTGKAAHNIHGMTLHSAFALSVTEFGGEVNYCA